MAAPNLLNITSVLAKSTAVALTTSDLTVLSNAASSGKVYKVNSLVVANVDGTSAADVTVKYYSQDDIGGTGYAIASTIAVPADASLVVIDKNNAIYLEEDKSIGAKASAAGDLEVTVSYEELS